MKKEQPMPKALTEKGKQNAKRYYEQYAERAAQLEELGALGSHEWASEETYITVKRVKRETS